MRNSAIIALSLAVAACGGPKLPDPRFELPAPPSDLRKEVPPLKTIDAEPENSRNSVG